MNYVRKQLLAFLFATVIPVSIFIFYIYHQESSYYQSRLLERLDSMADIQVVRLASIFDNYKYRAKILAQQVAPFSNSVPKNMASRESLARSLEQLVQADEEIASFFILTGEGRIFFRSKVTGANSETEQFSIPENLQEGPKITAVLPLLSQSPGKVTLTQVDVFAPIPAGGTRKNILLIQFHSSSLLQTLSPSSEEFDSITIELLHKGPDGSFKQIFASRPEDKAKQRIGVTRELKNPDLSVVINADRDHELSALDKLQDSLLLFAILATLAAILWIAFFARSFNRQIQRVVHSLKEFRAGNIEQVQVQRNDEFGHIIVEFSRLLEEKDSVAKRLNKLLTQNEKQRLAALNLASDAEQARKLAEQSESISSKFQSLVLNSDDAIISLTSDGVIDSWNQGAEKVFGYSAKEAIGNSLNLIVPDELLEEHERVLSEVRQTGESVSEEGLRKNKSGSFIHVLISYSPIRNRQGAQVGLSIIMRDVTERKQAERRFQLAVEAAPNAVIMVNKDGEIVLANLQAQFIFGYSHDELKGQKVELLIPEAIRDRHVEYREQFLKKPARRAMGIGRELHGIHRDGREFPVEVGLTPLTIDSEAFVLGSILDISERKAAESQIIQSLKEKELMLKEIHHRVKNNLQVISSLLKLQADYCLDNTSRELFFESEARVRSMAMVHEKLYQSQTLSLVDFRSYIEELAHEMQNFQASSTPAKLTLDLEKIPLGIDRAVPCGLILNELVSNAFKHAFAETESGEVTISLQKNDDGLISLSVADNGIGLGEDVDIENPKRLGLELVRTLCFQLDASLEIKRLNGTTFIIKFEERAEDTIIEDQTSIPEEYPESHQGEGAS